LFLLEIMCCIDPMDHDGLIVKESESPIHLAYGGAYYANCCYLDNDLLLQTAD
jgi:hypothetical protein